VSNPVQNRALVVCFGLVLGLSGLSARIIHLQWFDAKELQKQASKAREEKSILPAERGLVVDRNDDVLASNLPVTSVWVTKLHLANKDVTARGVAFSNLSGREDFEAAPLPQKTRMVEAERYRVLASMDSDEIVERHFRQAVAVMARHLRIPRAELRKRIEGSPNEYFSIAKDLREDVAMALERAMRDHHLQGFSFKKGSRRWYSSSMLATHSIGYMNQEGKGLGVEKSFNHYLEGRDGFSVSKRDLRGFLSAPNEGRIKPPLAGFNVQMTLDMGLQSIVEEELDAALALYQATKGSVLLVDPKTGDVLAIASRPHFNLNVREGSDFHYAVQAIFEPGSTMKIVATTAALDLGLVSPSTQIFCHHAYLRESGFTVKDHHPYGMLSFEQILAKSSNIGAFKLAKQVGRERFVGYLKAFGFTEKSGVCLNNEEAGLLADSRNAVNFSTMSYGYGVSVTPMQIAMAYSAVANGGLLMTPRLVKGVIANDGTIVKGYEPEVRRRVMKERTARQMRHALATVVGLKGTARRAAVVGQSVAGKTGTAWKVKATGGYDKNRKVVSFVGMLPADDPAFVCVVVIDDPRTTEVKIGGGTVAAPTFAKIATRAASYWNLPQTAPITESQQKALAASGGN